MKSKKSKESRKIKAMREGGAILASVRRQVLSTIEPGVKLVELDKLSETMIQKAGGQPSFKMVPGYRFATCLTVNEGVVHGIPTDRKIKNGDLVSIDVGMYYRGFHTDTATTVIAGKPAKQDQKFLEVGKLALKKALSKAKAGNRVGNISKSIQSTIESVGFSCSRSLTGHGIGAKLHEFPPVPCLLIEEINKTPKLQKGQTLAIEVIYAEGSYELSLQEDNWTLVTEDGKKAGLFEETVLITANNPIVLTN
jgi:methionyl aminopeptidase